MPQPRRLFILLLGIAAWTLGGEGTWASTPAVTTIYPMTAEQWQGDKIVFNSDETFPHGLMTVTEGYALLKSGDFADGTVEFDIKALAYADTGILIHRQDRDTAEFIYLRADPNCPVADDCVQYAPITNGHMQWNTYSRYQNAAPVMPAGWNHLRIVVATGRMRLYVNRAPEPSLDVPHLQGLSDRGGIAVKGPAIFANLVVRPEDKGGRAAPLVDKAQPGVVRRWLLGPVTLAPTNGILTSSDMPTDGWRPLRTELDGLANLARVVPDGDATNSRVGWLKAEVVAAAECEKVIDLGFVPRARLFLNGKPVYVGENFYYPAAKRLTPAGRFAADNARVRVSLHKGSNELVLAIDDVWRRPEGKLVANHYGWAGMIRFENPAGLRL